MKLKTTMERYLFACSMASKEYHALKYAEKHITERDDWQMAYEQHCGKYNFWQKAANRFEDLLGVSDRFSNLVRMEV